MSKNSITAIDPRGRKIADLGLQGGGKTYWAKQCVIRHGLTVLVFSPHRHDFENEPDNFIYYEDFGAQHIEEFFRLAIALCKKGVIDGVFIDEFEMCFKSNFDVGEHATDAFANHRHYDMMIIGITRRPQDIPAYYFESCHYIISFALQGENIRRKLNGLYTGFGDMVLELNYDEYEHIVKPIAKPPEVYSAV